MVEKGIRGRWNIYIHETFDKNKTFLYPNYWTLIMYMDGQFFKWVDNTTQFSKDFSEIIMKITKKIFYWSWCSIN